MPDLHPLGSAVRYLICKRKEFPEESFQKLFKYKPASHFAHYRIHTWLGQRLLKQQDWTKRYFAFQERHLSLEDFLPVRELHHLIYSYILPFQYPRQNRKELTINRVYFNFDHFLSKNPHLSNVAPSGWFWKVKRKKRFYNLYLEIHYDDEMDSCIANKMSVPLCNLEQILAWLFLQTVNAQSSQQVISTRAGPG